MKTKANIQSFKSTNKDDSGSTNQETIDQPDVLDQTHVDLQPRVEECDHGEVQSTQNLSPGRPRRPESEFEVKNLKI